MIGCIDNYNMGHYDSYGHADNAIHSQMIIFYPDDPSVIGRPGDVSSSSSAPSHGGVQCLHEGVERVHVDVQL